MSCWRIKAWIHPDRGSINANERKQIWSRWRIDRECIQQVRKETEEAKWKWRGNKDEEERKEMEEANWWGNDTNEGSRCQPEKVGEEATCIHQQKLNTQAEMPKKLANWTGVKLSAMSILGISLGFSFIIYLGCCWTLKDSEWPSRLVFYLVIYI